MNREPDSNSATRFLPTNQHEKPEHRNCKMGNHPQRLRMDICRKSTRAARAQPLDSAEITNKPTNKTNMKSIIVTSKPGLTPWITVSTMKVAEQEAKKAKAAGSRLVLQSLGYTHCPEFNSLTEAREVLREMVADSLANAKRKSADATKHQLGTDSYSITLGRDKSSCLWAAHSIQPD